MRIFIVFLLFKFSHQEEEIEIPESGISDFVSGSISHPCQGNGVVASWCDATVNPNLECAIHPSLNLYSCQCDNDPSACPSECVQSGTEAAETAKKTKYAIQCRGIPQDEPNYILRSESGGKKLPLHHCENNAVVANWCNELTFPEVSCLLLPSLNEYVCSCHGKHSVCPEDCVGGQAPDKKTKHGIRCLGIPVDQPNYILKA
jgi:hypothetical protein